MHRNDHPTAPGGVHVNADPARGVPGTVVTADLMNALQDEISHVIEDVLGPLDKADNFQLLKSIKTVVQSNLDNGDFVTRPELGNAAYRNVGTGANQVAAGNHSHPDLATKQELANHVNAPDPHPQYALEQQLGNAAYKNVGMGADQVAPGNHTHPREGSIVATLMGVLSNDELIPIPAGFTEGQCSWIVSPHTAIPDGDDVNSFQCYTIGRVVKIITDGRPNPRNRANYFVMGVR
jgi:hypothetical protein